MSIVILQTFKAAEGRYSELADAIAAMLIDTAARRGAELVRAAGDPASGVVTIFQQWDGEDNQRAYVAWRMKDTNLATMMALLREPPKIEQLSQIF